MTTNVNILSQSEWRWIHNALAERQSQPFQTVESRQATQVLMDKVRDNYIEAEPDLTGDWVDHETDASRNV